jgi:hypothetical protein
LGCKFAYEAECSISFVDHEVDDWIEHVLGHFTRQAAPPNDVECEYCGKEFSSRRDPKGSFRRYLVHAAEEHILRGEPKKLDVVMARYMLANDCIPHNNFAVYEQVADDKPRRGQILRADESLPE